MVPRPDIAALRASIAAVEAVTRRGGAALALAPAIDEVLPGGGLAPGAWHEIGGQGMEAETCAAPAAFAARIAAALMDRGEAVWVLRRDDLYAPGLSFLGLEAQRLIQVCAVSDDQALAVMEEALATPGVAVVAAETEAVSLVAGRRLQLACERTGAMGLVLHRRPWGARRRGGKSGSAAFSRWQVAASPSVAPGGAPGLGAARWGLELVRCRGGRPGAWIIEEAQNGPHPFTVVAPLGDGRMAQENLRKAG